MLVHVSLDTHVLRFIFTSTREQTPRSFVYWKVADERREQSIRDKITLQRQRLQLLTLTKMLQILDGYAVTYPTNITQNALNSLQLSTIVVPTNYVDKQMTL